jgi:hypothetical protein
MSNKEIKIIHKIINIFTIKELELIFNENELNDLCDLMKKYKI